MAKRATLINLENTFVVVTGEPILDTREGVLIIAFEDGTSRTFNWDHVVDYYYMTESELDRLMGDEDPFQ